MGLMGPELISTLRERTLKPAVGLRGGRDSYKMAKLLVKNKK